MFEGMGVWVAFEGLGVGEWVGCGLWPLKEGA